jgi:hypothetical protein
MSDREVAGACRVTHPFVAKIRSQVETFPPEPKRTGKDGKQHPATKTKATPAGTTSEEEQEPASSDPPAANRASVVLDILGRVVPEHIVPSMETAAEISALRNLVTEVKKRLNKLREQPGGEYLEQSVVNLDPFDAGLKCARFATTCPECNGQKCNSCRFFGWLRYGHCLSERQIQLLAEFDLKKMGR